jgi:hypothetical protein
MKKSNPGCSFGLSLSLAIGKEVQNARLAAQTYGLKSISRNETQAVANNLIPPEPVQPEEHYEDPYLL